MSEENEYAPGWRPNPGDEIEGKIVSLDARERNRPKPGATHYPILTIEAADGTQTGVHAFHMVLENEIKDNFSPSELVGSHIRIRYEGEKTTKDGENTYHLYKVFGGTRRTAAVAQLLNWGDDSSTPVSSDPPIAPSPAFAGVSSAPASSAPADADMGPLPPRSPAPQGEQFGDAPPF